MLTNEQILERDNAIYGLLMLRMEKGKIELTEKAKAIKSRIDSLDKELTDSLFNMDSNNRWIYRNAIKMKRNEEIHAFNREVYESL